MMKSKGGSCALLIIAMALAVTGCAYVISPEARRTARKDLSVSDVAQNPSRHMGATVIWGGLILDTLSKSGRSHIVVLEMPLDLWGRPRGEASRGRFIAQAEGAVDRRIYRNGKEITLVGEIIGQEPRPAGGSEPVVSIKEVYLWGEKSQYAGVPGFPEQEGYNFDRPPGSWWWW